MGLRNTLLSFAVLEARALAAVLPGVPDLAPPVSLPAASLSGVAALPSPSVAVSVSVSASLATDAITSLPDLVIPPTGLPNTTLPASKLSIAGPPSLSPIGAPSLPIASPILPNVPGVPSTLLTVPTPSPPSISLPAIEAPSGGLNIPVPSISGLPTGQVPADLVSSLAQLGYSFLSIFSKLLQQGQTGSTDLAHEAHLDHRDAFAEPQIGALGPVLPSTLPSMTLAIPSAGLTGLPLSAPFATPSFRVLTPLLPSGLPTVLPSLSLGGPLGLPSLVSFAGGLPALPTALLPSLPLSGLLGLPSLVSFADGLPTLPTAPLPSLHLSGPLGLPSLVSFAGGLPTLPAAPLPSSLQSLDPITDIAMAIFAVISTLLELDPQALLGDSVPAASLTSRDNPLFIPNIVARVEANMDSLVARQVLPPNALPSVTITSDIPVVSSVLNAVNSIGSSGVAGLSPVITLLTTTISQSLLETANFASAVSQIYQALISLLPASLSNLPILQNFGSLFAVLATLPILDASKFSSLTGLTNITALQDVAKDIPTSDLSLMRTLSADPDPTNVLSSLSTFVQNILNIMGNAQNFEASVAQLVLNTLAGLAPGSSL